MLSLVEDKGLKADSKLLTSIKNKLKDPELLRDI